VDNDGTKTMQDEDQDTGSREQDSVSTLSITASRTLNINYRWKGTPTVWVRFYSHLSNRNSLNQ